MDAEIAKLMLENLYDRIERNPETGKRILSGAISDREFEAIGFALAMVGGNPAPITPAGAIPVPDIKETKTAEPVVKPSKVKLNLNSLKKAKPQDSHVILCLDFGTAMSKASATYGSDEDLMTLPLGQRAGEPGVIFPVSSTLFFTRGGKVYFGHQAIRESLNEPESGRIRFDSPKQHMSRGDFELIFDQVVDKDINPTAFQFTTGELITLYLSFLTDLACCSLEELNVSRYVLRRFAMPCWQTDRAQWADRQMKEMLAKAQILADTFSGRWFDGLDAAVLRGALDSIETINKVPEYLVDQGVLEAVAAASGTLPRGTGERRLYMVIDVGAGTTDYGLFAVVAPKRADDRPRVFEVPGTSIVLRQAGDTIDKILLRRILEEEGIAPGDPEYDHVNSDLLLRIRVLKENMFREGVTPYTLQTDASGTVDVESFLIDERVKKFEEALQSYFNMSLENADPSWIRGLREQGITVVFTGGGAALPMVRTLGQGDMDIHGLRISCHHARYTPEWLEERYQDIVEEYPQLAVSIGGAAEELPLTGSRYKELGIPTGSTFTGIETHYKGS